MASPINRRDWLRQSTLAALGMGLTLPSLAHEEFQRNRYHTDGNNLINLGSNENPYGISPKAKQAIMDMIPWSNRYSFNLDGLKDARNTVSNYFGVASNNILLTAGSSIVLDFFPRILYKPGAHLVTAEPTFFVLPMLCKQLGYSVSAVRVGADDGLDLSAMLSAIQPNTQLVYVVNPNNPTGTYIKPGAMKEFCLEASKKTTVLIDEAYLDFLDSPDNESMIPLAANNPNIFVTRTFSKIHGMAGLRIGYLIGHPSRIETFENDYFSDSQIAISDLSLAAAMASLKDEAHRLEAKHEIISARDYTVKSLQKLNIKVTPSFTNFIHFPLGNYEGDFADFMLKKNIILRNYPIGKEKWGRVSVGTMPEMQQFIKVMNETWKA